MRMLVFGAHECRINQALGFDEKIQAAIRINEIEL